MNSEQAQKIREGRGFIAALDQSGGSTPKALAQYGMPEDAWSGDDEMFAKVHEMRSRIITSPAFDGDKIIGAILFEKTMDGEIEGTPTAQYLWEKKGVVPFLKIDKGLEDEHDGVQLMKPMPGLDRLLDRAVEKGIFGTKERSVVNAASKTGIAAIVAQQFEVGRTVLAAGLMPILEPEVSIKIADKADAEVILKNEILQHLEALPEGQQVMLKLTLPDHANHYAELVDHPKVLKVVALSGGYSMEEANAKLAENRGVIASFSRALVEGIQHGQSADEFDAALGGAVDKIHAASVSDGKAA